jgi:hypothetical protein
VAIYCEAAVIVCDFARGEIKSFDIGDATCAVDDALGFRRMPGTIMSEDHTERSVGLLDPPYGDIGLEADSDAFALGSKPCHSVSVHRRQELRQGFKYGDLHPGARKDVAKFERDDATPDKNRGSRQPAVAQDIVRGDHVLGTRNG